MVVVVVVVVVVDVVVVVVVARGTVVVVVAPVPDVMTNPQPRSGSFNVKGSETASPVGGGVLGGTVVDVVVVVVTPVGVVVVDPVLDVVDVVVDVVVVVGALFVTSRPRPVKTRASNTTRRTNRNGHRRAEGVFRDAGTVRDGNSQMP
jgi:hypothetical protein